MKKRNTTKLIIHNITENKIILVGNKEVLSEYFRLSRDTIINWFRNKEGEIVKTSHRLSYSGCDYIVYRIDHSLVGNAKNKTGKRD